MGASFSVAAVIAAIMSIAVPRAAAAQGSKTAAGVVQLGADLEVRALGPEFWLVVSKDARGIAANALIARFDQELVMVDTPWTDAQTERLLQHTSGLGKVVDAVITHSHADRMGGIVTLRKRGIRVRALDLTVAKAAVSADGAPDPEGLFAASAGSYRDARGYEVFYPGAGHTTDNVVVWFPKAKLLFGGCLVKAHDARELGYVAEANLTSWPKSIRAVAQRYRGLRVLVPGHGEVGLGGLENTLALLEAAALSPSPRSDAKLAPVGAKKAKKKRPKAPPAPPVAEWLSMPMAVS